MRIDSLILLLKAKRCLMINVTKTGNWCHNLILDFRQFAVIISIFQPSKLVVFTIVKYRNKETVANPLQLFFLTGVTLQFTI